MFHGARFETHEFPGWPGRGTEDWLGGSEGLPTSSWASRQSQSHPALLVREMDMGRALPQTAKRSMGQGRLFSSSAPLEVTARTARGAGQPGTQGRLQLICLEDCSSVCVVQSLAQTIHTDRVNGGRQAGLRGGRDPCTRTVRAPQIPFSRQLGVFSPVSNGQLALPWS